MNSKYLGVLAGLLLAPTLAAADGVIVGDREWRQPIDTTGFDWSEVASVCSATTGVCAGSLDGVSFDGWTWASIEDVQELFEQLIKPGSIEFPTIDTNYQAANDPDIRAALGPGGFTPLATDFGPVRTGGWTRSVFMFPPLYFAPYLLLEEPGVQQDFACLYCAGIGNDTGNYRGNWMYRPATPTQLLDRLAASVAGVGPGDSFSGKIADAQAYFEAGDIVAACSTLNAFQNQLRALSGKRLSDAEAAGLTESVNTLKQVMGCT